MDPQGSKEKGVVSRHDQAKVLASVLDQEQAGSSGTAGVRKGRGQGSVRVLGKNPVPVRSYNSKTGERGWH